MTYETKITLDLSGSQYNPPVVAKQGDKDSRYIIASLIANGAPYHIPDDATARISVIKPRGQCVLNDAEITGDSTVKFLLTEQMLVDAGTARAEVMLFTGGAVLSSAVFDLEILPAAYNPDTIESAPEYQTFIDALARMDEIDVMVLDTKMSLHLANKQNPHGVTAVQTGAIPVVSSTGTTTLNTVLYLPNGLYLLSVSNTTGGTTGIQGLTSSVQRVSLITLPPSNATGIPGSGEALEQILSIPKLQKTYHRYCRTTGTEFGDWIPLLDNRDVGAASGVAGLDENGSLDLDVMPVGTTWTWWNDNLPSDKWMFGNTDIPDSCTKARAIWGTKTPDTAGRVLVDKSSTVPEFNAVNKAYGETAHTLIVLETPPHKHKAYFHHNAASPGSITGGFPIGEQSNQNWDVPTETVGGGAPHNNIQPSIVCRFIYKIR